LPPGAAGAALGGAVDDPLVLIMVFAAINLSAAAAAVALGSPGIRPIGYTSPVAGGNARPAPTVFITAGTGPFFGLSHKSGGAPPDPQEVITDQMTHP
jgi:hypothetical protein